MTLYPSVAKADNITGRSEIFFRFRTIIAWNHGHILSSDFVEKREETVMVIRASILINEPIISRESILTFLIKPAGA